MRVRPTLERAIAWIAQNDEPLSLDVANVEDRISVLLIADLFGKAPEAVASRVVAWREKYYCKDRRLQDASGAAGVLVLKPEDQS